MEVEDEEKKLNEVEEMHVMEPSKIFYSRGMNHIDGHGLDPLLFSTVKIMIRDINKAEIITKPNRSHGYEKDKIMPFFKLYHRYISKVKITGFVIAVKIKEKYIMYTLDDSTGCINCKLWKSSNNVMIQKRQKWKIGDWLKIEGILNYFIDTIEINVELMEEIIDPNEECLHWLECANIFKNVLSKPLRYHIDPPPIKLSKNAQKLLELLHQNKIKKFEFKQLISSKYGNIKEFMFEIVQYDDKNKVNTNNNQKMSDKQFENKCLFKLRDFIRELSRFQKLKLIDINKDIYVVN